MILASTSPRRIALVRRLGVPVTVIAPQAEELTDGDAVTVAVTNARRKACSIHAYDVVLGADTVVCLDGVLFGKPIDDVHAVAMLSALRGKTHQVITGICLTDGRRVVTDWVCTRVTFDFLTDAEIERYVKSGRAAGKAGAYGIQDEELRGRVTADGDYDNVVGLPVARVAALYKEHFHGDNGNSR